MNWEDSTSYRQGERRGAVEPRAWTKRSGPLHLSIVKGHVYHPGAWVVHIRCNDVTEHEIGKDTVPADDAKQRSIVALKRWLADVNAAAAEILREKP
jgi:hypothetical protein